MKEKIIWWLQLTVNCLFFLSLVPRIDYLYNFGIIIDSCIDVLLMIVAWAFGYTLTVKFENDPGK